MNAYLLASLAGTLTIIVGLSIWSGTQTKQGQNQNSWPVVTGIIMGTLVGGSATVGTAQLAYNYGMSAGWFALGASGGCLLLAVVYTIPLRRTGCLSLVSMIGQEFGATAGMLASILSAIGTFINIISQIISATAVIAVIIPELDIKSAVTVSGMLMVLYVFFGGTRGVGIVGIAKTILLYLSMIGCGMIVLSMTKGFLPFVEAIHRIENPENINFFSLFARGGGTDMGACFSMILGVLTTQTYAQGVLSGRTDRDAVKGSLLSAFLVPPIGIGGILVGLYMRANAANYPNLTAKTALTTFVISHMPPVLAGIVLGTLFVSVIGAGAGLALGISTILNNDVVNRISRKPRNPQNSDGSSRLWIIIILFVACLLSVGNFGEAILQFAFMSMGLRGAVVFVPLIYALWLPGKVNEKYAILAIVFGPTCVFVLGIIDILPFDPFFIGILGSAFVMGIGQYLSKRKMH